MSWIMGSEFGEVKWSQKNQSYELLIDAIWSSNLKEFQSALFMSLGIVWSNGVITD